MKKKKKIKDALKRGAAEKFEQLQLRLELNFIREAGEVVVREWAAIQQVKDHLNAPLRLCLLQSELIVSEIGQWRLDNFVHSLKALMGFLNSMTDMALTRVDKILQAKPALLNGATSEERKKVLNGVHRLAESSAGCSIILQQITRLASNSLICFRESFR